MPLVSSAPLSLLMEAVPSPARGRALAVRPCRLHGALPRPCSSVNRVVLVLRRRKNRALV